jgi:hypothetical protein
VLEVLRCEAEFQRRVGQYYEHGGGSGGGGVKGLFRRATSRRKMPRDFDTARAKASVQTRIDTDSWTSKGKSGKEAIWRAWSKWFHVSRIPSKNTDNPYFHFSGETNSAMGYVISFVLLWYCFRICSHVIMFCFR